MSFLNGLETLLGIHQAPAAGQAAGRAGQLQAVTHPAPAGAPVANPQPETQAQARQFLAQHPQNTGMYPSYNAAQTVGQANRFVNAQQFPQLAQGGNFNPGYIPLQSSGNLSYNQSPQPTAQFRGQPIPQAQNFNPQNPLGMY